MVDDVEREHANAHRDVGGRKGHDEEVRRDLRVSLSKLERGPKYWLLLLLVKKRKIITILAKIKQSLMCF